MLGSGKTTRRFSAKTLVFSDEVPIATPPSARGGGKGIETDDGGGNIKQRRKMAAPEGNDEEGLLAGCRRHNGHGGTETPAAGKRQRARQKPSLTHFATLSPFCTHSARLWHSSFTVLSQRLIVCLAFLCRLF
ncbi:hypothetical protein niasHS_006752 [Heterodera schachtii]|uniref:Uncharacterized protein n=1 Tax=Heterodera schachtii TaxID=97005 RepID=A0ABD2JI64_HETSC